MKTHPFVSAAVLALAALTAEPASGAQVHHHGDGHPWKQTTNEGPDAESPGWFYNLGITGIRVRLEDDAPTHLIVGHVMSGSPAEGRIEAGDRIVGAGGKAFEVPHRNGYGMEVFGPQGPIEDFAAALEASLGAKKKVIELSVLRGESTQTVKVKLPPRSRGFAESFPFDCPKTESSRDRLLDYLLENQQESGSFGSPVHNTFAALALLSDGSQKAMRAVEKNARFHARTTQAEDDDSLINWRYMTAAIVLSEYYFVTKDRWIVRELEEIYAFLKSSQYMDLSQLNPEVKNSHPDSYPEDGDQQHGGWGHNVGFEGYGPIAMTTGQGALAFSLMERVGIEIDEEHHRAAYAFLDRGTGSNGYTWYADSVAGDQDYADMGRTGASGIAHWFSPFEGHKRMALRHATCIGENPLSFPDTHASPLMGMGYTALAASVNRESFERLMDANRWWFTLAECHDGTFCYQPNRDSNGYGADSRLEATAVTAFILSIPDKGLVLTGKR